MLGEKVAEPTRNSTSCILWKPTEKQRSPFISTPDTTSGLSYSQNTFTPRKSIGCISSSQIGREKWAEWNWCCLRNTAMWPLFSFSTAFSTSGWLPKLAKPANSNSTMPPQIFCCCFFFLFNYPHVVPRQSNSFCFLMEKIFFLL